MRVCRCMALDLDGTLLSPEGRLTALGRRALEAAAAAGVHIVAASGRAYETLPEEVTRLPGLEYAVTSNGAAVYRIADSACILSRRLSRSAAEQALKLSEGLISVPVVEFFAEGTAYGPAEYVADPKRFGADAVAEAYIKATRKPYGSVSAFLEEHGEGLDGMAFVIADQEKKKSLWRLLEKEIREIYVTASVPRLLEIAAEGSGKEKALSWLLKRLGVEPCQTAAFGNGENDAAMLSFAGLGVAVANADPACLEAADRIAAPNSQDGAAKEILRILKEGL